MNTIALLRIPDASDELSDRRSNHPQTEVVSCTGEEIDVQSLPSLSPVDRRPIVVCRVSCIYSHIERLVNSGLSGASHQHLAATAATN